MGASGGVSTAEVAVRIWDPESLVGFFFSWGGGVILFYFRGGFFCLFVLPHVNSSNIR